MDERLRKVTGFIVKRVRFFFTSLFFIFALLGLLQLGMLGPWYFDTDYYPPHLTWDGTDTPSTSVTVNFRTPPARCAVYYREVYPDGTYGPELSVTENTTAEYHHITVTGLKPYTKYEYRIEELTDNLRDSIRKDLGRRFTFTPMPPSVIGVPNSTIASFKFAVIGDNRHGLFGPGHAWQVSNAILSEPNISFVLNTGDLVMAGGGPDAWWRRYFMENEFMRLIVTMPTKGNHEDFFIDSPIEMANSTFEKSHAFPGGHPYYSFNVGRVHFICLLTTDYKKVTLEEGEPENMLKWLRNDLASINTSNDIDFIIIYQHYPLETIEGGENINRENYMATIGKEFRLARVVPDLLITGHVHDYERLKVRLGDFNGDGTDDWTWQIIAGNGGAEIFPIRWEPMNSPDPNAEFRKCEFFPGYTLITVNGTALTITAKTLNGYIFDNFTIEKGGS